MAKYGVFLRKSTPDRMVVVKTTVADPADSDWDSQDGEVDFKGIVVKSLWAFEHDSNIHIATQQENGRVAHHVFNPGTDTYTIKNETVAEAGDTNFDAAPANHAVAMAVRVDGDIVIVAAYNDGTNERLRAFSRPSPATLWAWGESDNGRLGNGTVTPDLSSPVQIGSLTDWVSVSAGAAHTLAVKTDDTLWAWGLASSGQLGDGSTTAKSSPVQIGSLTDWVSISGGSSHSIAVKTNGTLWAWGLASGGQLGDGSTTSKSSPVQIGSLTDWVSGSAGGSHSLAVKDDGTLWTWGGAFFGQLGDGSTTSKSSPVQIGSLTDWVSGSVGDSHSLAVKDDGTLWAWGNASDGRLGNGTTTPNISSPVQIGALTDWASVSAGSAHSLAVKTNGTLWAWGLASGGQLGDGSTTSKSSPVQIGSLTDWVSGSAGGSHSLAVKDDGTLWTWGLASSGQLGNGTTTPNISSPVQIGILTDWVSVSGGNHSLATKVPVWTNEGEASGGIVSTNYAGVVVVGPAGDDRISWAYGDLTNDDVDLRSIDADNTISAVTEIDPTADTATLLVAPGVIDSADKIYLPYIDADGQISIASWVSGATPTVALDTTLTVRDVFGQGRTTPAYAAACLALDGDSDVHLVYYDDVDHDIYHEDDIDGAVGSDTLIEDLTDMLSNTLWAWGFASSGQLGDGSTTAKSSPVQIGALTNWTGVGAGGSHSLGIKTDNTLWAWGLASSGQLGDGSTTAKSSPVQIGALIDWVSVDTGSSHSFAIKTDNTLWAWGAASNGRLGDGTTTNKSSPVQIGALTDWANVSAGSSHSLAVKTGGALWAWGSATNGKLGNGTTTPNISSPIQIGALTDWNSVGASTTHSLAVKTNGALWAWGLASSGQLGDGSTTAKSSPVQIGALIDWASISVGGSYSLAVKTDGTLWAWGLASSGQLGDGSTTSKSSPVQIGSLTDWAFVDAGDTHSLAVKTDGTLWAWGESDDGRLGNGTATPDLSSPVQIGALTTWVSASGGGNHSLAVTTFLPDFRISANVIT